MKIQVLASTKMGYEASVEDSLRLSGLEAGICYMPDKVESLLNENESKTFKRVESTVLNGHHSVSGHPVYNLVITGIPKILAMLLNNEKEYVTSEKSGRYTVMYSEGRERELYEKWLDKFSVLIAQEYPDLPKRVVRKLAMENARYFISVFTPATTMGYTVSLRQANYLIGFCEKMIFESNLTPFYQKLIPYLVEFSEALRKILEVDGLRDNFGRGFSLITSEERDECFSDVYSVNYLGSFAQLAQAQRHRSIWYEMKFLEDTQFYVPLILSDAGDVLEYLNDIWSIADNFPQGMLVKINERGTLEAFEMKCHERLCGSAQLEICDQTLNALLKYVRYLPNLKKSKLNGLVGKTKCRMGFSCHQPCPLGANRVFSRKV